MNIHKLLLIGLSGCALMSQAELKVVIPTNADRTIKIAADEFCKYYAEITGTQLVVTAHPGEGDSTVKIGFTVSDPLFDGETDAYIVKGEGANLTIVGKNSRSALYGVYDFFKTHCGCRWFWDGDVVPKAPRIDFSGVNLRERSQFLYRGCQYFAHRGLTRFQAEQWGYDDWRRELDWCAKNRLNVFMMHFGGEDLFQCAYPDIVPYPDPAVTSPCDSDSGYDQRTPFWSMQFKHQLRLAVLAYARDRGIAHPEKIGPMTHWFFRTPPEFLEAKKPDFMPQIDKRYSQPSGFMWDIRQPRWFNEYWKLTEAACNAYGKPELLFNPGFDERTVYSNRAANVSLKINTIRRYNEEAKQRYPDLPVVMEGWDFFLSWKPEEMRELVKALDPTQGIIWDFTADDIGFTAYPWIPKGNVFTGWGVTNAFPYTFGYMLAFNRGMDIRGQYDFIRRREKAIVGDPMCKGYLIWPENSHTDIFAWRYFTDNCWALSPKTTDELLADFCRDRYGKQADAFLKIWRKLIPLSQLVGWGSIAPDMISRMYWGRNNPNSWFVEGETPTIVATAPEILKDLAAIDWNGDFVRRDAVDLARTAIDRALWHAVKEMMATYHLAAKGKATADELEAKAKHAQKLVESLAAVLAMHTDFSVAESLDRINAVERVRNPEFEHILYDNSVCGYCLAHQAEYARGWYVPAVKEASALLIKRARAKDFSNLPELTNYRKELRKRAHPLRDFAPDPTARTPENFRRALEIAYEER